MLHYSDKDVVATVYRIVTKAEYALFNLEYTGSLSLRSEKLVLCTRAPYHYLFPNIRVSVVEIRLARHKLMEIVLLSEFIPLPHRVTKDAQLKVREKTHYNLELKYMLPVHFISSSSSDSC